MSVSRRCWHFFYIIVLMNHWRGKCSRTTEKIRTWFTFDLGVVSGYRSWFILTTTKDLGDTVQSTIFYDFIALKY